MNDIPKQARVFRVQGGRGDLLAAEDFFDRLHNAEHPIKRKNRGPLQLNRVFSRIGSNTFLINLTNKAAPNVVEAVVKEALGPGYGTECVSKSRSESFVPVERTAKGCLTTISTVEREAATTAPAGDSSATFVLVDATQKVVYSYNDLGHLTKENLEPRGAHIDVGSGADTVQIATGQPPSSAASLAVAPADIASETIRPGATCLSWGAGGAAAGKQKAILDQGRSDHPSDGLVLSSAPWVPAQAPRQAEVTPNSGESTCRDATISVAAGKTDRSGGIPAAGAEDAVLGQPAGSEDGAVPVGVGGKRTGSSQHEGQADGMKRAKAFEQTGNDAGEEGPSTDDGKQSPPVLQQSPELMAGEENLHPGAQLNSTSTWKDILSKSIGDFATTIKLVQEVIDADVVPQFVAFLQHDDNPALLFGLAWVLTNMSSGTSDYTRLLIEEGAVSIFVRLIMSPNDNISEQAVIALGKIAKKSPVYRDLALEQGAMGYLIDQLSHQLADRLERSILISATRTLSILCRGKRHPTLRHEHLALPTLARLIRSDDEEVLRHACRTLRFLCAQSYSKKEGDESDWDELGEEVNGDVVTRWMTEAIIKTDICHGLVELLDNTSPAVQTQASRAVRDMVDHFGIAKAIIGYGALPRLRNLLIVSKDDTLKFTWQAIAWLMTRDDDNTQSMIKANILPAFILAIAKHDHSLNTFLARDALLSAIRVGEPETIKELIPPLLGLLKEKDEDYVELALDLLEKILEGSWMLYLESEQMAAYMMEIGGGELIKQLQKRDDLSSKHKEQAQELLRRYSGILRASDGLPSWDDVVDRMVTRQEWGGAEQLLSIRNKPSKDTAEGNLPQTQVSMWDSSG